MLGRACVAARGYWLQQEASQRRRRRWRAHTPRPHARPPPPAPPLDWAEKLGTGLALVRSDVGGNIERVATAAARDPPAYEPDLFQLVRDDVAAGTHTASSSVTKGLLWLKR